jgi:hypothetical protein
MSLGALVNYSTYALCIAFLQNAKEQPWYGVAAGSIMGLALNFGTSRRLFRR